MVEIKITEMPELLPFDSYTLEGGTEPNDYLPIIDTSETDPALKNKKVSTSTLFEKYLNAEDTLNEINAVRQPFIDINSSIDIDTLPISSGSDSIAIGADSSATNAHSIALGFDSSASNLTAIAIGAYSLTSGNAGIAIGRNSSSLGQTSIAIGSNIYTSAFHLRSTASSKTLDSQKSDAVGAITIGNLIENTAEDSIAIGSGVVVSNARNIGIGNCLPTSQSPIFPSGALVGALEVLGEDNIALGTFSGITNNTATKNIAIGHSAEVTGANTTNAVQLATGTNNTSNTLKYLSNTIANLESIQARYITTATPSFTAPDGTLVLSFNGGVTRLFGRANGVWRVISLT